jgi:pilus assembly protein CpaD
MKPDYFLRAAALASILIAGSCSVANDGNTISEDGSNNHPIMVEPSYRDLKVQYAGGSDGVTADDAVLAISVPNGPPSRAAITFFAERAAASGISRDKILVSTHDVANGDYRVDVNYITYSARTDTCGDWSEDLAFTADNVTPKNYGCSVQHNIAAMVSDPRDLIAPRPFDTGDGTRAATIIDNYEQGKPTSAQKTADQSAAISDVNKQ